MDHSPPSTVNTVIKMDGSVFAEYFEDLQNQI